jgi:hypothetical protein
LSDESRKSLQKLKIIPGAIVHIYCPYIINPHEKFVVIVHVDIEDDLVLGFFINSEINQLVVSNPDKLKCQIELSEQDYSFLDHDSYLDCSEVQDESGYEEMALHLASKPSDHKGMLDQRDIQKVLEKVREAKTISDYDKSLIADSFDI